MDLGGGTFLSTPCHLRVSVLTKAQEAQMIKKPASKKTKSKPFVCGPKALLAIAEKKQFVEFYIQAKGNLSEVARRMWPNEIFRSAYDKAQSMLHTQSVNTELIHRIDSWRKSNIEEMTPTTDKVLAHLAACGFSDMGNYLSWGPAAPSENGDETTDSADLYAVKVVPTQMLGTATRAIKKVEVKQDINPLGQICGQTIKLELHDKKGPLELMGKHLGMFKEDAAPVAAAGVGLNNMDLSKLSSEELKVFLALAEKVSG
jgi:hypothetical protein